MSWWLLPTESKGNRMIINPRSWRTFLAVAAALAVSPLLIATADASTRKTKTGDIARTDATSLDVTVPLGVSAQDLEKLVQEAPAGATVWFLPGTYEFSSKLEFSRGDIALRGAGVDKTTLIWSFPPGEGDNAIEFVGKESSDPFQLASNGKAADRTIRVKGGPAIHPGNAIFIEQPNEEAYFSAIGFRADAIKPWMYKFPLRQTLALVDSVNGNTVRLSQPLGFDYSAGSAVVKRLELLPKISISDFSMTYAYGKADASSWGKETLAGFKMHTYAIRLEGLLNPAVKNLHVQDAASGGYGFYRSYGLTADHISIDGAHNKKGGEGYAFHLGTLFASKLHDLTDREMRHSLTFDSWSASAYNDISITFTDRDINFHGGRSHHNYIYVKESNVYDGHNMWITSVYWNMDGEQWGAPVDRDTNDVQFSRAIGGRNKDDKLEAAPGGAWLDGKSGNDVLLAGKGDDMLIGGPGADTFIICPDGSHDTILDFNPQEDILAICDRRRSGAPEEVRMSLKSGGDAKTQSNITTVSHGPGTRLDMDNLGGGSVDLEGVDPSAVRIVGMHDLPDSVKRTGGFH
jgi:hypothetical protein